MDRNNLIGNKNKLPWSLPNDLAYFKKLTQGNIVIMGRKTYESIGKALPNRINIVLTRDMNFKPSDCLVFNSIESILSTIAIEEEVFIIGGSNTYEQFLPYVNKLYITHIDHSFIGDSYFPDFDESKYEIVSITKGLNDEKNPYDYNFVEYKIKNTYCTI